MGPRLVYDLKIRSILYQGDVHVWRRLYINYYYGKNVRMFIHDWLVVIYQQFFEFDNWCYALLY